MTSGELAADVHRALVGAGSTVATAESLTGGRLAALLTAVPGASASYRGGVIAYASDLKIDVLGVSAELVEEHGVVSEACARAMAEGVRRLAGAMYALSTTGVAGPDWSEGHPPGTAFVGVATSSGCEVRRLVLEGERATVQEGVCHAALTALRRVLTGEQADLG